MLFAWQNEMPLIAAAMLCAAVVFAAKGVNKTMLLGALVAIALAVFLYAGLGDSTGTLVIGGLFVIFLITVLSDSGQPAAPYGGGYQ